jgi:hypothetical protein
MLGCLVEGDLDVKEIQPWPLLELPLFLRRGASHPGGSQVRLVPCLLLGG